jgi:hypothetical protein
MRKLLILLVFVFPAQVRAQGGDPVPVRTFTPYNASLNTLVVDSPETVGPQLEGQVELVVDLRIEKAMSDYGERKHTQQGYRVQLFLGERRLAEDMKRSFLLKYSDTSANLSWLAPNFRLRVGDFRTRLEAERLLRDLKAEYPGSYIVRDEIEPPALPVK